MTAQVRESVAVRLFKRWLAVLRSALFVLWMVVTVVPFALAAVALSIFVRGDPVYWVCIAWLRLCIHGARVLCGVRHRVAGMEHLPSADSKSAVLLCPKHQSTWETFAFPPTAVFVTVGMVELFPSLLLNLASGPQIAVTKTATHMAVIASDAHISGMSRSDHRGRSWTTGEGSCDMVDIFLHPLSKPILT